MKAPKKWGSSLIMCLFELAVGILLLLDPVGFTSGIIIAAGVALILMGLIRAYKYFRMTPEEGAKSQALAMGLVALLAGVFCVTCSQWFVVTFPVLTLLYGIASLVTGLVKIQRTVDILRLKEQNWLLSAIGAVLSVAGGVIIICSPFGSTAVLWIFTGISLIAEAVFDAAALLLGGKKVEITQED